MNLVTVIVVCQNYQKIVFEEKYLYLLANICSQIVVCYHVIELKLQIKNKTKYLGLININENISVS